MFRQLFCIILILTILLCYSIKHNTSSSENFLSSYQLQYNNIEQEHGYINTRWPVKFNIGLIDTINNTNITSNNDGISFHGSTFDDINIDFIMNKPTIGFHGPIGNQGKPGEQGPQGKPGKQGSIGGSGRPPRWAS